MPVQHVGDELLETGVAERAGREVHADDEAVTLAQPERGLVHSGIEHPSGQVDHEAGRLRQGQECPGRQQAELRVLPPQERLDAAQPAAGVELRLVVQP